MNLRVVMTKDSKSKLFKGTKYAAALFAALFAVFFLIRIFPVSDGGEIPIAAHEIKLCDLLKSHDKGVVSCSIEGENVQIYCDTMPEPSVSGKLLCDSFLYLRGRAVGEEITRVSVICGDSETQMTHEEFSEIYASVRNKTMRNHVLDWFAKHFESL